MSKVIVCGASGYGASIAAKLMADSGHKVIVVENLDRLLDGADQKTIQFVDELLDGDETTLQTINDLLIGKMAAAYEPPIIMERDHPSTIRSRGKGKRKKSWERPSFY